MANVQQCYIATNIHYSILQYYSNIHWNIEGCGLTFSTMALLLHKDISSPVHKLLCNFSTTLGFFSNFPLVEQLSVHRATFQFLCLDRHNSHAPATSETIKKCRI